MKAALFGLLLGSCGSFVPQCVPDPVIPPQGEAYAICFGGIIVNNHWYVGSNTYAIYINGEVRETGIFQEELVSFWEFPVTDVPQTWQVVVVTESPDGIGSYDKSGSVCEYAEDNTRPKLEGVNDPATVNTLDALGERNPSTP